MIFKLRFKKIFTLALAGMMLLTAAPVNLLAGAANQIVFDDKTVVRKEDYLNKSENDGLEVKPAKLKEGETAEALIKNPEQPDLYTIEADFKLKRGDEEVVGYQPYIATVGAGITDEEKNKISKEITMPELDGYTAPNKTLNITHDFVEKMAKGNKTTPDKKPNEYIGKETYLYKGKEKTIKIKHLFQDFKDFNKYGNLEGHGEDIFTEQKGFVGTFLKVQALDESIRKGFVPESNDISTQVPEGIKDFVIDYHYNRANYDIVYDCQGGTDVPARTAYFGQEIPKIDEKDIPTKKGCEFLGWKPSHDLKGADGTPYKKDEVIKDTSGNVIVDLGDSYYVKNAHESVLTKTNDIKLTMPALKLGGDFTPREKLTFTAVWKDKDKANYTVYFWAEKADHDDNASLSEKYEFIGAREYKDQATGSRPDLDNVPVDKIVFPDLNQARLAKIWNGDKFYAGKYLFLNKFYVYNKDLTDKQNKDPESPSLVKSVDATGKTVYNIYYDRQVYDIYFTKSNKLPEEETFCPEIWEYDEAKGEAVKKGGPSNLYMFKARFNQLMDKWPNDAMQTKGFDEGKQSYGWGPNYGTPEWPVELDSPPYRLNADEFLDMKDYDNWGGYVLTIDKGDSTFIDARNDPRYIDNPYLALNFGIKQGKDAIPHHMDIWVDGFKDGETIIRYDLVRTKPAKIYPKYGHKYPKVQGFTPYNYVEGGQWPTIEYPNDNYKLVSADELDDPYDPGNLNVKREAITPFPKETYNDIYGHNNTVGELNFMLAFFNNADDYGEPVYGVDAFEKNGYLRFKYTRNKHPLRFNIDPTIIKKDDEFGPTNSIDTFYEFPLKCLSPEVDKAENYKNVGKGINIPNLIDDPKNLQALGLTDLVETGPDGKLRVKRPGGPSDKRVFKGWALDPEGQKLIWENDDVKMPDRPIDLYAIWGEPDYQWKLSIDPNGGEFDQIGIDELTTDKKTVQVGDIVQEKKTFPIKRNNEDGKQVFTVINKQKLNELPKPEREGYDFMGWEVIRYKKNANGDYTNEIDDSYRKTYNVPELYSFDNEIVSPICLKAIWAENKLLDIVAYHHYLDQDYKEIKVEKQVLKDKRIDSYLAALGSRQNAENILVPEGEWELLKNKNIALKGSKTYKEYQDLKDLNGNSRTNTYNQVIIVGEEKVTDPSGQEILNPNNQFHFYYRDFKQRNYTVKYIDDRAIEELNKAKTDKEKEDIIKKYTIITDEKVTNGKRHFDARNYRPIPGWKLVSAPQQQVFFDIDEKTNELKGINGTGKKEITFYYKDVRVIEVPGNVDPPKGYVRVTFKADKGGSFGKDKNGKDITELHYDVIKGLKSEYLPVPKELAEGEEKVADKYYITPETGKKFIKWDEKPLLNKNTILDNDTKDFYVFTAKFEWSGLSASGLVRTEAFTDPNGKWTNDFAPKIADLKKQLVWMEKGAEKPLPTGAKIKFFDEAGNELTTDEKVYELVNEKKAADKDELVRTVNIKAKVTFTDGKEPQELNIPITVYKNVYEALTTEAKPLFLSEAEEGELKNITGKYVKVTVNPTGQPNEKNSKIYYVNKNAWVNIDKVDISQDENNLGFRNWTANVIALNEDGKKDGVFNFASRHKFTEETEITPSFTNDIVEQKAGEEKPKVPDNYKKVIVTTEEKANTGDYVEKASDETKFIKTFWINPTKEITIPVKKPTGKTEGPSNEYPEQITWLFKEWTSDKNLGSWSDDIKATFTDEETKISAVYEKADNIKPYDPSVPDPMVRPDGYVRVTFKAETGLKLTEQKAYYVKANAGIKLGNAGLVKPAYEAQTGYKFDKWDKEDDLVIEAADIVVTAKATKLGTVIPEKDSQGKNNDKPKDYKEVVFVVKSGDENKGSIEGVAKFYVHPTEYVTIEPPKTKANTGFKFGTWDKDTNIPKVYAKDEKIIASFNGLNDVVPKTKPDGSENTKPTDYKTVTFAIDPETGGKIVDKEVTVYYVNPAKEVTVPQPKTKADTGYVFEKWDQDTKTAKKYTDDTRVKGNFKKLEDIVDGTSPKPEGYVTVTFLPGDNGTLSGKTKYYVNPDASPVKTMNDITEPTVTAKAAYKVADPKWKDSDGKALVKATQIKSDLTYTAQYKFTEDLVKQEPGKDKPNVPEDFVKVQFRQGEHGTIDQSQTTIYWVNPEKEVDLTSMAPTVKVDPEYKHTAWDKPLKATFATATDITAQYKKKVVDKDPKDATYVKVTFKAETNGNIKADEKAEYWILKDETVELKSPAVEANTNYAFKEWNPATQTSYSENKTHNAVFVYTEGDVVPQKPGGNKPVVPPNFVEVEFTKGANGEFVAGATTTYWVNPEKDVTVTAPKVEANKDYKHVAWTYKLTASATEDKEVKTLESVTDTFKAEKTTITAKYLKKVLDNEPTEDQNAYVEVKFNAGTNGQLEGNISEKSYRVLKDTPITFDTPKVTPNDNYKFIGWDSEVKTAYSEATTHVAQYKKIIVTEDPKEKDYVKVTFDPAAQGTIKAGFAEVWVLSGETIDPKDITPGIEAKTGYTFKEWTPEVQTSYSEDAKHSATYTYNGDDVVSQKPGEDKPAVPNNYVKVTFKEGTHGIISASQTTIYWVNPTKEVDLTNKEPLVQANVDYKHTGWDKELKTQFATDADITAQYKKKVVTDNPNDTDYVEVDFKAGTNGTIASTETTTYWVLKNTDVTVREPKVTAHSGYTFTGWDTVVKNNYDANATHTAQYKENDKDKNKELDDLKDAKKELDDKIKEAEKENKPQEEIDKAKEIIKEVEKIIDNGGGGKTAEEIVKVVEKIKETIKILGLPAIRITIDSINRNTKEILFTTNPGNCTVTVYIYFEDGTEKKIDTFTDPTGAGVVFLDKALQTGDVIKIIATRITSQKPVPDYLDNLTTDEVN